MEGENKIKLYKPVRRLAKLLPYILRRGLIPFAIGIASFIVLYAGLTELLNRFPLDNMKQNLFNPVMYTLVAALIAFAVFSGGLRHGEYVVLGASRRSELILAYIFGTVYSAATALFTVGIAYAFQKLYSLNTELYMIDLEYSVKSFIVHWVMAFLTSLAAFALTRAATNINGRFAKRISIALIFVVFVGAVVFVAVYMHLLDEEKVATGLAEIFKWRRMLPLGLSLLAVGVGADVANTMFEYIR